MCCNAGKNANACKHLQAGCKNASNTRARPLPAAGSLVGATLDFPSILLHEPVRLSLPQKLTCPASTQTITTASQAYLTKPLPTYPLHFSHPQSTTQQGKTDQNHPSILKLHVHCVLACASRCKHVVPMCGCMDMSLHVCIACAPCSVTWH